MAIQERLYTVDDVWRLAQQPENELKHFYLIDGELFWNMAPGYRHGRLEILIAHHLLIHAEAHDLGEVTGEVGFYPADESPYIARARCSLHPQKYGAGRRS